MLEKPSDSDKKSPEKKLEIYTPGPAQAEQGAVSKGKREKATIMVLKIKNAIGKSAKQELEKQLNRYMKREGPSIKTIILFMLFSHR